MLSLAVLYKAGYYTDTIIGVLIVISIIIPVFLYFFWKEKKKNKKKDNIIDRVGEKRFNEINNNKSIFDIIEHEILEIDMVSKYPRAHLTPSYKFTGKVKEYWDDKKKNIRYELNFKQGQECGKWRGWYKNGQLAFEQKYDLHIHDYGGGVKGHVGRVHGITKVWNKSGELYVTLEFKDGELLYAK